MKVIDLRSDTLTKPSLSMRKAIYHAVVGDNAFEEDLSVIELEEYCASLFGKEKALFMPSGTMSNQVAIKAHTNPGDEVITDSCYHINFFESAQTASLTGVTLNLCYSENGLLTCDDIDQAIKRKPRGDFYSKAKLICLENTVNATGGTVFSARMVHRIATFAKAKNLAVHIDGARILNACATTGEQPSDFGSAVDSLSLCFAKGLGAPFGSILMGSSDFIGKAKVYRKWFGGALHQAGFMAAAASHALRENWREILERDHYHAKLLADGLRSELPSDSVSHPSSNIVLLSLERIGHYCDRPDSTWAVSELKKNGVLVFPWTDNRIRFITHRDHSEEDILLAVERIVRVFEACKTESTCSHVH